MVRALSEILDRCAMDLGCRSIRDQARMENDPALLRDILADPDFFGNDAQASSDFSLDSHGVFQFTSRITTPSPANNRVYGKIYHQAGEWTKRPSVVLLHGWNADLGYQYLFPLLARRLIRRGVNAVLLELPYHCHRRPRSPSQTSTNFLSSDLVHTLTATRQALNDIRSLMRWLAGQGSQRLGLWGFSLGTWLGGLVTIFEPLTSAVALTTPIANLTDAIRNLPFCAVIRHSLAQTPVPLDALNLMSYQPLIEPKDILLVEATYDLFAPKQTVEALWRHWNHPEIWRIPHGHISALMSAPSLERTARWLANRLLPHT